MKSTRRGAFKVIGAALAVATLGAGASREKAKAPSKSGYLGGLEGATFATSTVVAVGALEHGAVPVTLVDADGKRFVADLLRHDPVTPGVAQAGSIALHTRGRGTTVEAHGLALMALAEELAAREDAGAVVPPLASLRERGVTRTRAMQASSRNS